MKKSLLFLSCVLLNLNAQEAREVKLDPIIVTATRSEIPSSKAPGSFTVITKDKINKMPAQSFKDAIKTEGVYISRNRGLADTTPKITIRGIPGSERNLVMLDGIILNDSYSNGLGFLSALNMQDIDQIEIIRGPFSSLYGTNAMGGVINFRTFIPTTPEFKFNYGYGDSFDSGKANENLQEYYVSAGGAIGERLRAKLSYGYTTTHGYRSSDTTNSKNIAGISGAILSHDNKGKQRYIIGDKGKNGWENMDLKFKSEFDITENSIASYSFMYHNYEYDYKDPRSFLKDSNGNTVYKPSEKTFLSGWGDYEQFIHSIGYEHFFDKASLSLRYTYKDSDGKYSTPQSGANLSGGKTKITTNDQEGHFINAMLNLDLNDKNSLLFGTSYDLQKASSKDYDGLNYKDLKSTTNLLNDVGGKTKNLAFFVNLSSELTDNLSTKLSLRYDRWKGYSGYTKDYKKPSNDFLADSSSEDSISPKASISWEVIEGTKLKASVGKAFRAPTVYDLYKKWDYYGRTYHPNPFLEPETSISYDAGIEQAIFNDGLFKIYYFENHIDDMIYGKRTDSPEKRNDKVNAGEAKTYGYEISLDMPLWYGFGLNANYTKTFSEMKENEASPNSVGKRLTHIPRDMFNATLYYKYSKLYASLGVNYVSKVYGSDTNDDTASGVFGSYDSYTLWDAKIGYDINENLAISFEVQNIFDKDYYSYYKGQGRSWFARVESKF